METFRGDTQQITLSSLISPSKSQASSDLMGETVILELESGVYYGLNETGTLIWNLINQSKTLEEISDRILSEYDIEPEQCNNYILKLVRDLADKGLVTIENKTVD
ncbi:hypothetical protein NIES4102_01180 [Chondrocystis sp. NIES-4102]|nr:hypothetical protein NIES4102_01180 [Chondrocystis sp. NIES-4102]